MADRTIADVKADLANAIERAVRETMELDPEATDEDVRVPERVMVTDYVVVASWMDSETGTANLTRLCPPHMQAHQRSGLLHEALYNWD